MVQIFAVLTSYGCIASPNLVYGYLWRAANTHIYDAYIRGCRQNGSEDHHMRHRSRA